MFWQWSYAWPMWWWFPFHGLFSVLLIVVVVLILVSIFRPRGQPPRLQQRSQALQILEERYARGEIQREEYLQKKQDLGGV